METHEPAELWYVTRSWYAKAQAAGLTDAHGFILRWGVWSPDPLEVWTDLPLVLLPFDLVTPLVAPFDTLELRR